MSNTNPDLPSSSGFKQVVDSFFEHQQETVIEVSETFAKDIECLKNLLNQNRDFVLTRITIDNQDRYFILKGGLVELDAIYGRLSFQLKTDLHNNYSLTKDIIYCSDLDYNWDRMGAYPGVRFTTISKGKVTTKENINGKLEEVFTGVPIDDIQGEFLFGN